MNNQNKENILGEFNTMKILEQDAHDFYLRASQDPDIKDDKVKNHFSRIAKDEQYHIELVEQIINIVTNCL